MFSNLTIGFLFGVGIGAWIYSKLMRTSGGNTKNAVIGAIITGIFVTFVAASIIGKFINK